MQVILPEFYPEGFRECYEDVLVGGVKLGGGAVSGGVTVMEAVGEGLAVGGELLAGGVGEDVEALGGN